MKRLETEEDSAYKEEIGRWTPLFEKFATLAEKEKLDKLESKESKFRFIQQVVLSDLEKLSIGTQGNIVARILSFLPLDLLKEICTFSTTLHGICKFYKLRERFYVGQAFLNRQRIVTLRPVVSVGLGTQQLVLITDDGNAYKRSLAGQANLNLITRPTPEPFIKVEAGTDHFMFITRDTRSVYGYGYNNQGQLGSQPLLPVLGNQSPRKVLINERARKVCCRAKGTAVLTETGNLYLFGFGTEYSLANGIITMNREVYPLRVNLEQGVLDVALNAYCTIILTEDGEVLQYGSIILGRPINGEAIHYKPGIERVYCLDDGVAYLDSEANVRYLRDDSLIASNVQEFKGPERQWLTQDGQLYPPRDFDIPLPVKTFDVSNQNVVYLLSGDSIPKISVQCINCGQSATHYEAGTFDPYCQDAMCISKRLREDETEMPAGMQRQRQETANTLSPTTRAILENPRRMQDFAMQVSRDVILTISNTNDGSFYGQINRDNLFWFWISKRFVNVGFNRLVNYKDIAGRLI